MKKLFLTCLCGITALMGLTLVSCEKAVLDEETQKEDQNEESVITFRINAFTIEPFETRSPQNIVDYCTRLEFAVYQDGQLKNSVSQKKADNDYGTATMALKPGSYKLMILAYSSNATVSLDISNPQSISFANAMGFSDTFYYYSDLTVTSSNQALDITMQRAASALSFTITDELPNNLYRIKMKYSGGSRILNATTGMGVTKANDSQEVLWAVDGMNAPLTLNEYTFMPTETGYLTLTVTALDSNDNVIQERTFTNVPMQHAMKTIYSGPFFTQSASIGFSLKAETDWETYKTIQF